MPPRKAAPACPVCAPLGEECEIENPLGDAAYDAPQAFPPAAAQLGAPNPEIAAYQHDADDELLVCPACGAYFHCRHWIPGGSDDVLRSYLHESLRRLTPLVAREHLDGLLDSAPPDEALAHGVAAERRRLRRQSATLVAEAAVLIAGRGEALRDYGEELARAGIRSIAARLVEEERIRIEAVAVRRAGLIAEHLPAVRPRQMTAALTRALVALVDDPNPTVAAAVRQALQAALADERVAPRLMAALERPWA